MAAHMIDGRAIAAALRESIAVRVKRLAACGRPPILVAVLVGEDPASEIYVRNKIRQAAETGIDATVKRLPASTLQQDLMALIETLNNDEMVDGILVQLPLPAHIAPSDVFEAIVPAKDVDGFHPLNVGRLVSSGTGLVPCTPKGCLRLIQSVRSDLRGLDAVVVGCSNIVGRPMAQLLLSKLCTVSLAHVETRNLKELCRRADILVVATGHAELVRGGWVKSGATVIDVGISRCSNDSASGYSIVGDVAFEEVRRVAGALTPVPGGVGPMTIACLLENTLEAAVARRSAPMAI